VKWDPAQYARYADERGRAFLDLVARVEHEAPRRVIDLGCGPGTLTRLLAERWPEAVVEGIDSSPEMIERANQMITASGCNDRLSFRVEDVCEWDVPADADVIVSNATLQWVPGHQEQLRGWAAAQPVGGWIAVQVPGNFASPSHVLMRSLATASRWRDQLGDVLSHHDAVGDPAAYAELFLDAGLAVDAWETTYIHLLHGDDPVLEWVRGTGLRPILDALSAAEAAEFEGEYAAALREAYPRGSHGTPFPFRRVFAVAHRAAR
jgi:trans-aconitate 2-methyltransferase